MPVTVPAEVSSVGCTVASSDVGDMPNVATANAVTIAVVSDKMGAETGALDAVIGDKRDADTVIGRESIIGARAHGRVAGPDDPTERQCDEDERQLKVRCWSVSSCESAFAVCVCSHAATVASGPQSWRPTRGRDQGGAIHIGNTKQQRMAVTKRERKRHWHRQKAAAYDDDDDDDDYDVDVTKMSTMVYECRR